MTALVDAGAIEAARRRIAPYVARPSLVALSGSGVLLKPESLQPSGSFKVRGAFNSILQLDDAERSRGVVAHSSGNHAQAVAYAGGRLGVGVTVVMPDDAPARKVDSTRQFGANVIVVGPDSAERARRAGEVSDATGAPLIEPYDSDAVLAATATIAREIADDAGAGDPLEVYVPISGGGLAGGLATGCRLHDPSIRVIGVEPELAATAGASHAAGARVEWPAEQVSQTIADGLRVRRLGRRPWEHLQAAVDVYVTVSEAEIRSAMILIAEQAGLVAEPSGAVAAAAAVVGRGSSGSEPSRRVAILSGRNVDTEQYAAILVGGTVRA